MELTPDNIVYWKWGFVELNATIVFGWVVTGLLVLISWLATRNLSTGTEISPWQNFLEALVEQMQKQLRDVMQKEPERYLPFIGTLFLYIGVSNLLMIVPYYQPPTASLSTTTALALAVFVAVPFFGIAERGLKGYLESYVQPTILMLPFNIIGEVSRTFALAIRLFGNIMSGTMIVGVLVALAPLFFPIVMNALGVLTGMIQAYIFAVLTAVYIAAAIRIRRDEASETSSSEGGQTHE